ncbi:photosystem II oxygen evolving complex protein PsbP [Nitzschia inconspicua]|uniref:Photosystem II oxygen evolving complex protein PsbP n=1 Tax=Nitzschia inconspicua TaxID=303405 RepID=A0A9K3P887_9STRA|nr:photosystem II oxygen evolving complex protein PsbP [Nitzschia inconspicua]KAG7360821.1 photosystem II oxygen evolving complex protein PsbP [Nitzschia inconspicua]
MHAKLQTISMLLVLGLVRHSDAWSPPIGRHSGRRFPLRSDSSHSRKTSSLRRLTDSNDQSNPSGALTTPAPGSNSGEENVEPSVDDCATPNENAPPSLTIKSSSRAKPPTIRPNNGPTTQDLMLAMGTNPRRIILGTLSASGIALAGNFLGVTSRLLMALPEDQVEATGIDTYFPRGDYKRCRTADYTFVVPKEWVADTFVELAKAQRKIQPLDYSMQRRSNSNTGRFSTLPDSAYGPAGRLNEKGVSESGDTNVSVIVSSGLSGFTLEGILGTPANAAEKLLSLSIAPEGSGRTATLLNAVQNNSKYIFEYLIDRGQRGPLLRNIAVIAPSPSGDKLYTLTVVAPAEKWKQRRNEAQYRKIAESFHLR